MGRIPPRILLITAALLFSTGGAAIKATHLAAAPTAASRSWIAAVLLLVFLPEARRGWRWAVLPAALAYAGTLAFFVHATKLTTSANAIFLQSTAPLWMLILGPVVLRERLRRSDWMLGGAMAVGMSLFFAGQQDAQASAPNPALGNLFGAASGLSWALTLTGFRWLGRRGEEGSLAPVVAGNLLVVLFAAPSIVSLPSLGFANVQWTDLAVILYLGAVQIALAYACLLRGLHAVSAFEASALLLLEPVANPIWTWLFHHEQPTGFAIAGGVLILVATLLHVRFADPRSTAATGDVELPAV